MVYYSYSIAFLLLMLFFTSCRSGEDQLKGIIEKELSQTAGTFAVAFKDLNTGYQLLIRADEVFHAASTMKTPVMIEVFKQASTGRFSLTDSILIKNEFRSIVDQSTFSLDSADDSEQTLYSLVGQKKPLNSLVYDMIIASSNLATNLVIELVDAKNVTETMRQFGAKDIEVLRGVEDMKAFRKGLNNTITAADLLIVFEKMANGETVNREASDAMIDILLDQRFNTIIPAELPSDVKVAHKTGTISGAHHDSGIVFLPDGRKYVLVLLSKDLEDTEAGTQALARVSGIIYNYVVKTAN